ncbi:MAG: hypothetical protein JOZ21_15070 [Verrucomicrobia bacterium]|nr:hypothetical protein [Verrucomicrobiota bacterium]
MNTQSRLAKITTASSLTGLALGFSLLGCLILAKGNSEGASLASGLIGVLLGAIFLMFAFSYWRYDRLTDKPYTN